MKKSILILFLFTIIYSCLCAQKEVSLQNDHIRIHWQQEPGGWKLDRLLIFCGDKWTPVEDLSGKTTLLFSSTKPPRYAIDSFKMSTGIYFPDENYKGMKKGWEEKTNPVALNTAGQAFTFLYKEATQVNKNEVIFSYQNEYAVVTATWRLDERFRGDIVVEQHLKVKKDGYYSLATPTLSLISEKNIHWATVPGYFQGDAVQHDFVKAYAYGMGIPDLPVVYRERCASTLCPLISTTRGVTFSVIPNPGLARDPWEFDHNTHTNWFIGLSDRNRENDLFPTLYYPVLGEAHSGLQTNDQISYTFRYSISDGDWFKAINHAVYDIYKFDEGLSLRRDRQSLTSRIEKMHHYLTDSGTSLWNIETYQGMRIGAQSYRGGVVGSDHDAMKNSDYGAMWLLAAATKDSALSEGVLPYALNFKIAQQIDTGFFKGAIKGQYYLSKSKRFVEEWGSIIEPIGVTYYNMLDIGNMLLFEPKNSTLKQRLKNGADFLLRTQKPDGSWPVAYSHEQQELFKDIPDARPTFYGLLVGYKILKDPRYLKAARKGADWYIDANIEHGYLLGVCGDARYAADFATGQTAQALLDLFDVTQDSSYLKAAIFTAKIYVNSIYTHPIPSRKIKIVNGRKREDWEISQSGLSFEHGGILGSANTQGPIQLCSHAGLFIRMYGLTKERIFRDMARAGAIGRDAFVDSATSVASYYWRAMNKGAGPYPHHAWWQIGWITDYLLSEAQLRSENQIVFPRGFVTPKVGAHVTYGFAAGKVFGDTGNLIIKEGFVSPDCPSIDYILVKSVRKKRIYIIFLNDQDAATSFTFRVHPEVLPGVKAVSSIKTMANGNVLNSDSLSIASFGIKVLAVDLK